MKRILGLAMAAATMAAPAMAADIGLSINVGQPGFFGQLDIGAVPAPAPALIFPRPMVIRRAPDAGPPVYLHVPAGYERHWARHCAEYNACGRPVYFVRDEWYQREYAPRYQERFGREPRREEPRRDERRDERHDERRDDSPPPPPPPGP